MINRRAVSNRFILLVLVSLFAGSGLLAQFPGISPEEYRQRRDSLLARMESHSVAVFRANDPVNRSNDVNYRYRQESNFFYLTGINEPRATLMLGTDGFAPDGHPTVHEVLFIEPSRDNGVTGETLGLQGAKARGDFELVLGRKEFSAVFDSVLNGQAILYLLSPTPNLIMDPYTGSREIRSRETKKALEEKYPKLAVKNPGGMMAELRVIKSEAEVRLLERAIRATTDGQIEAMKSCEPGMAEYELQAIVEYCFAREGAQYQGFPSIVGSGPNSCILHYEENTRTMGQTDVVVMDIGAEFDGYSADVTRTIPVSGTFTSAQRELYDLVYSAQEAIFRAVKPGAKMGDLTKVSNDVIGAGLVSLGILKDASKAQTYTRHGVSHFLGLDVHDVGPYGAVLEPGMVLTVEPGIYIPEGSACDSTYWNTGIRIEDDVLVTDDGCRVLSSRAPRASEDVERVMKATGISNVPIGE